MATYAPPKRATQFIFYFGLKSQADTKLFQVNPTLAAGDVKVSIDGGATANLATLPVVTPASGRIIKVTVSTSEMTGDNITLTFHDAAGAEWCDIAVNIQTTANQFDDLATPANVLTQAGSALSAILLDKLMLSAVTLSGVHNDSLMGLLMDPTDPENFTRANASLQAFYANSATLAQQATAFWEKIISVHSGVSGSGAALLANIVPNLKLQRATAGQTVYFYMRDTSDPKIGKTGLSSLLTANSVRSIDRSAVAAVTGTISEIGFGLYALNTSIADTTGTALVFFFVASGGISEPVRAYTHV